MVAWAIYRRSRPHAAIMCVLLIASSAFYLGLLAYAVREVMSIRNLLLASVGGTIYATFGILSYPGKIRHLILVFVSQTHCWRRFAVGPCGDCATTMTNSQSGPRH